MEKLTQNHTASAALGERHFCLSFIPHPDSPFPEDRNCCPQSSPQHRAGCRKSAITTHQIELTRMLAIGTKLRMFFPTRGPPPNHPPPGYHTIQSLRRLGVIPAPHHHTPASAYPRAYELCPPKGPCIHSLLSFHPLQPGPGCHRLSAL